MNLMARLHSKPPFLGTKGPVTTYAMFKGYYMRSRSSLTAQRVKTDPAFRKWMMHADLMKIASPLASSIYRALPAKRRPAGVFNKLVGEVTRWLKYGWQEEEIVVYLMNEYAAKKQDLSKPVVTVLKTYRRKTQRIGTRRGIRKERLAPKERKSFALIEYQYRERKFRKLYNEGIKGYPWSDLVGNRYSPNVVT